MTPIITIDRLILYNSYKGDVDGFSRAPSKKELKIFGDDVSTIWSTISSKLQDIDLISKRLTSKEYTKRVLLELKEICDSESSIVLTGKINFYSSFQLIAEIIQEIKNKISSDTDVIWAGLDSVESFLTEMTVDIQNIRFCDFTTLDKLNVEFVPTSTYQEISHSNGWGNYYIELSEKFKSAYESIVNSKPISIEKKQ